MNGPVDVLAVMEAAAQAMFDGSELGRQNGLEIQEARAAVAELIEADKEYDVAKERLATQRRQVGAIEQAIVRFQRAEKRRRTAIANVGRSA